MVLSDTVCLKLQVDPMLFETKIAKQFCFQNQNGFGFTPYPKKFLVFIMKILSYETLYLLAGCI